MTADEAAFFVQNGLTLGDPALEEAAIRYHLLPIYDEFVLSPLVRSGLVQSNDGGFVIIDRTEQVVRSIEMDIALNGSTDYTPVATLVKTAGITGAVVIIAIIPGPEDVAIAGTLALRGAQLARAAKVADEALGVVPNRTASKIDDITKPGSKLPNIKTDVPKSEFETSLLDSGFTKSTSKDGSVTIFINGEKKYTTRNFSKSTDGPTAEVFINNKPVAKIRLGGE